MPLVKTCQQCKSSFIAKNPFRRFCSYACSGASKRTSLPTLVCVSCNKQFTLKKHRGVDAIKIKYCSRQCYFDGIVNRKTCAHCGKQFTNRNDIYCSRECVSNSQRKRIGRECATCGKEFQAIPSLIARGFGNFCSLKCARAHEKKQPVEFRCARCDNAFTVIPSQLNHRTPKFCSQTCYRNWNGETEIESKVRNALEEIGVFFLQEHPLLDYHLDFYLPIHAVCIEADGEYWHRYRKEHDSVRDKKLQALGVTTIRLDEPEIMNSPDIAQLIRASLGI